jgi:hypothetical protein
MEDKAHTCSCMRLGHYFPEDITYAALFRATIYTNYPSPIKIATANFEKIAISFFGTPAKHLYFS